MEKNENKNSNKLGIIYLILTLPGYLIMSGSAFIFDDPETTKSIIANIFFCVTFTMPFTLFATSMVCFWKSKVESQIGANITQIVVYLPVMQFILFILTIFAISTFCGGEFCV